LYVGGRRVKRKTYPQKGRKRAQKGGKILGVASTSPEKDRGNAVPEGKGTREISKKIVEEEQKREGGTSSQEGREVRCLSG